MSKIRVKNLTGFLVLALAMLPAAGYAQGTAIAGAVTDSTGGVLPGVTVEARSPALIEQVRTAVTDGQGQYRIIDLRPGSYTVTFSLPGFSTVIREGIRLESDFTANVTVQMRVGALEETVTVSGATPVVDVQSTQRREVLSRDMADVLPTGRNYQTLANTLPAVTMGRFDVAGSTAMQQGSVTAYGGQGGDFSLEIDGMSMSAMLGQGSAPAHYINEGSYQEYVVQVASGNADTQTPGIRINQVPKDGGNQFSGFGVALYSDARFQGQNATEELRARGLGEPAEISELFDYNWGLGGPIKQDRLWFFHSGRVWAYNNKVQGQFLPDGSRAVDANLLESYDTRLTWQVTPRNKFTAHYNKSPKERQFRELELGNTSPEATVFQSSPTGYIYQAKWTSTVTNRLLIQSGFSGNLYAFRMAYRPEVKRATCFTSFADCAPGTDYGDVHKRDVATGDRWNAYHAGDYYNPMYKYYADGSASYVTGSHSLKTGVQVTYGHIDDFVVQNGNIWQQYRNGVPDSVVLHATPLTSRSSMKYDLGIYVQDTWTIDRLTLNPGFRYQQFVGEIPAQTSPAGRFVPARSFDKITDVPNWQHVLPRFGVSYDVFGDGRTAIKGHVGFFTDMMNVGFQETYNPLSRRAGLGTDTRTWRDLNGDDIAQENEMGPSTNLFLGVRRNRNFDPDIKRPRQTLYSLGMQHELRPGLGLSATYYRRDFSNLAWTDNLATTFDDYTLLTIADPRGNGETLPLYNLDRSKRGLINELDTHSSENDRTYNGIDVTVNARLPNGLTLMGGTSTGRTIDTTCQVEDPNRLRFCDQSQHDLPLITTFKLSGTYPFMGWRASAVFQSVKGDAQAIGYRVTRSIVPALTLPSVTIPLNAPGTEYLDRVNQLDISFSRTIRVGQVQLKPQLDLFNALNVAPVLSQVTTFGSALGRPRRVLDARLLRFGVQVEF